ncbi:MAG: arsenate reductase ArsC [Chlorobiaceae bacterium]|nr:arsenate reductase ArsC [Chlorobiaceae bacterium]
MSNRIYNVLFICSGNSARSIMAEAILNDRGHDRFKAYSAGSRPRGEVEPVVLELLGSLGFDTSGLRSKSWHEFAVADAPQMDFIFTVCDRAAGEQCPIWPGQPISGHWSFPDPVQAAVTPEEKSDALKHILLQISNQIRLLLSLPIDELDEISLHSVVRELCETKME